MIFCVCVGRAQKESLLFVFFKEIVLVMAKTLFCSVCNDAHATPHLANNKVYCACCQNELTILPDADPKAQVTAASDVAVGDRSEQIKQIRSSLQHSAKRATEELSVQTNRSERINNDHVKKQSVRNSSVNIRSEERDSVNAACKIAAFSLIVLVTLWWLYAPATIVERCLSDFGQRLSSESIAEADRIAGHRERMWLVTRDGLEAAPIILNIDQAQISAADIVEVPKVANVYAGLIGDMVCNRRFAIWHESGQAEAIEKEWSIYQTKNSVEGFYLILKRKGISFVRFADVYAYLLKKGFNDKATYVLSLLLAGTMSDNEMSKQLYQSVFHASGDDGRLHIWEIAGSDGNMLMDAGGFVDVKVTQSYCGLLLGMSDSNLEDISVCRVLDLRLADQMDGFYGHSMNPLCMAAYESMRRLAREAQTSEHDKRRLVDQQY